MKSEPESGVCSPSGFCDSIKCESFLWFQVNLSEILSEEKNSQKFCHFFIKTAGKQEGKDETNEWGSSWTFVRLSSTIEHECMEGRTEMHNSQDLQKVLKLREAILAGSEQRLKEQRDAGKLTARERVEKLADAGSFVEQFALVSQNEEGAGVITGYCTIDQRPVYIFAQDFTVRGGAMGKAQAAKIVKLLDMALKTGAPVLAVMDSAGVRIDEGAAAMSAYSEIYQKLARMSGVCPIVSLVLGPCIGGAALLTQLADVTIVAEKVGQMMVFGPQVMAAMNGMAVKADEFGGAKVVAEMGACALTAETDGAVCHRHLQPPTMPLSCKGLWAKAELMQY